MHTIRRRLFFSFVLMVLLPAMAFSVAATVVGYRSGRQQVFEKLDSVATIKEAELKTWVDNLQAELGVLLFGIGPDHFVNGLLSQRALSPDNEAARAELRSRFSAIVEQSQLIDAAFVMNLDGKVVLSSDPAQEGGIGAPGSNVYFQRALTGEYLHPPSYTLSVGGFAVVAARPIIDANGETFGVLAVRAGPEPLDDIMLQRAGLGQTGETYLVTRSHVMLTQPRLPRQGWSQVYYVFTEGTEEALTNRGNGASVYVNYRGEQVIGVYRWLPELGLALMAEQSESEAMLPVYATMAIYLGVTAVAVVLAAAVSSALAGNISHPLSELAHVASRVAAGDLGGEAPSEREDEIGALARAFNSMTDQLRGLIGGLEQRVAERTEALREANVALRRRALQLETSAHVSREVTSILNIDDLLSGVVGLIRDAFGFYHVHIFLLNEEGTRLLLRASSAAADKQVPSLSVTGQSLNSRAAQTNEPVLVNDVAADTRFLWDVRLSDVRSELVVPLRTGERVLGTLDVQSSGVNAFTPDDLVVVQSLGDQIAVAIQNARLYDQSRELAALEERHRLARELHDSVAQSLFSLDLHAKAAGTYLRVDPLEAEKSIHRLRQITHDTLQEMRSVIHDLRPRDIDEADLQSEMRYKIERMRRADGPEISLTVTGTAELSRRIKQSLLRIAQEAIHNALRHAGASRIVVVLSMDDRYVSLGVSDDGCGFDPTAVTLSGRAFGLAGMSERTTALNGNLEIESSPGAGTRIRVSVPIG
jgi:nitrate/nitrite-specific signal transduction histidine kinase